jgi:lysophospholipase L1-like esterase
MCSLKTIWTLTVISTVAVLARSAAGQPAMAPQPPINPKLPTFWVVGDSTVREGQDNGDIGQWGWGNPIASYFDHSRINVQNRALGGTSSKTFRTAGRWEAALAEMKPGDFLILQFGHNDRSPLDDKRRARGTLPGNGEETREIDNPVNGKHEVVHTFGWYMRQYVAEAKAKGVATVIMCSPIPRNNWVDGKVKRDVDYTKWAQEAANQSGALFINLNELVAQRYDAEGQRAVTDKYFPEKEVVHPDWAGAVLNAEIVVEAIKKLEGCELAKYLLAEAPKDLKPPSGKAR